MTISPKVGWLLIEQDFPWELEESFYWFLQSIEINRFSFESLPDSLEIKTLRIWLPASDWSETDLEDFVASFKRLAKTFGYKLPSVLVKDIDDEDWSSIWKEHWYPDPIGEHIVIWPVWLETPERFSKRTIIRLDPGSAFGTGSHPSTRLCLEKIERKSLENKYIADIGCGSGILSLASIMFGAKQVFAVDTDSLAISATKRNLYLNNSPNASLTISHGSSDALILALGGVKVDLLFCNILAPVIKTLAADFDRIVNKKGIVVLSGILIDQFKELDDFFKIRGWTTIDFVEKDKWMLMEISRKN